MLICCFCKKITCVFFQTPCLLNPNICVCVFFVSVDVREELCTFHYKLKGCRFGPESKPNPGNQYLDPAKGTICGGLFPKMFFGDKSATSIVGPAATHTTHILLPFSNPLIRMGMVPDPAYGRGWTAVLQPCFPSNGP